MVTDDPSVGALWRSFMSHVSQQPCHFCGDTPAPNGSIYKWPEALGMELCVACCDWEIDNAHPEYCAALERDNASPSGDIGEVHAWLNTVAGKGERRAWEGRMRARERQMRAKGYGKGTAGSRSRSPRRFQGLEQ